MMTSKLPTILACLCLLAACGKNPPQNPEPGKSVPKANATATNKTQASTQAKPKGKSYRDEYIKAKNAAFEAKAKYDNVKRDPEVPKSEAHEHFFVWAEQMYEALACANLHEKSGHSLSELPQLREIKEMRSDMTRNSSNPNDHPRVKAAMEKVKESAK